MSKIEWKNLSISNSWSDLSPNNIPRRSTSYEKTSASAPTSTNAGRRQKKLRASLRAISNIGSKASPVCIIPQDCIAWQAVSQQLSLQLEQKHRSELAARRSRPILLDEEHKAHVMKVPSTTVEGKSLYLN